jgi:transcriptional regulator with XRE-family HTH domain
LLQKRLDAIGMTQTQLGDKVGMSRQQISDYATDYRKMSLKNAKLIADAVGCHIDDLYEWHYDRRRASANSKR